MGGENGRGGGGVENYHWTNKPVFENKKVVSGRLVVAPRKTLE